MSLMTGENFEFKNILIKLDKKQIQENFDVLYKEFTEFVSIGDERIKFYPSVDNFVLWLNCKNVMTLLK